MSLFVLAADNDQVADTSLRELAFDARHPDAADAAVGAHPVQENARVADVFAAVGSLAPLVLDS